MRMSMKPITVLPQPARQRKWVRERKRNLRFQLLLLDLLTKSCRFDRLETGRVIQSCWLEGCSRETKEEEWKRGEVDKRQDGWILISKQRSVCPQLADKSRRGGKRADEKKPKGSVMALRMRDSPSSSQGHTTSKSCQSAGSQERRGEHTRTHSTVQRLSVTSLVQRCSAAATRSCIYPYSRSGSIGWWKTGSLPLPKTPGYVPPKEHDASMYRVTGSSLSLACSLHTPFFSFTLRICLTFHFLPPSPSLSLSLAFSLPGHTHAHSSSLSQSWADWDACKIGKRRGKT